MSLTLIAQPQAYGLANNPTEFRFNTDNLYQAAGDYTRFQITPGGYPAVGKQLIINWAGNSIIFTFVAVADNSGYQISLTGIFATFQEWIDFYFIPALQANYYINTDFDVFTAAAGVVELKARNKGTAYNLSIATDAASGLLAGATIITGANQDIRPNFETYLELYIAKQTTTDWQRIIAAQTHANAESRIKIDSIISADYYGSALPDFGGISIKNISTAIIKYYARYGEAFGQPKLVQKLAPTATYYALHGGFTKDDFALKNFFTDYVQANKLLLHWPASFTLTTSQAHYLNYLHTNGATSFKIYTELTYTDKTTETKTLYTQSSGVTSPSLYCIPAGYAAISPVKNPAKTVFSYKIWVGATTSSALEYSQKINHVIDARAALDNSYFLFKNSFGVFEVVRCTGQVTESSTIVKQQAQRQLTADYAITDAATITWGQTEQRSWQVNSGFKSKTQMRHFVDFLLSPNVYKIQSTVFVPVTITISEADLAATRSGRLNNVDFTVLADVANKNQSHV